MKAIDTNILLRYLLNDDEDQSTEAASVITSGSEVLVTDIVLTETIWTLVGKKYRLKKFEIEKVIEALLEEGNIVFENGQVIWQALMDFRNSKRFKGREVDFSDALILNKSRALITESGSDFEGLYTFDLAAQQLEGARHP